MTLFCSLTLRMYRCDTKCVGLFSWRVLVYSWTLMLSEECWFSPQIGCLLFTNSANAIFCLLCWQCKAVQHQRIMSQSEYFKRRLWQNCNREFIGGGFDFQIFGIAWKFESLTILCMRVSEYFITSNSISINSWFHKFFRCSQLLSHHSPLKWH